MLIKLKTSLKNINYKLFIALLIMGLCPTIYTTIRVFWLGQLPGEWSFSIAGQLSWVNLIYEIINEAIILPLFYFVGKAENRDVVLQLFIASFAMWVVYLGCVLRHRYIRRRSQQEIAMMRMREKRRKLNVY